MAYDIKLKTIREGIKNDTPIANVPEKREWQFFKFSGFRLNLKMKTITILKYACYIISFGGSGCPCTIEFNHC